MNVQSRQRLSKKTVDSAVPLSKRYEIRDTEVSGLGLSVSPSGSNTHILRYRPEVSGRSAPKRFVFLGKHGILTPDQARTKARKMLGAVLNGDDPARNPKTKRLETNQESLTI